MDRPWYKHYETGVHHEIVTPNMPLYSILDNSAAKYPEHTALIFGSVAHDLPGQPLLDSKISYQRVLHAANRFSDALRQLGIKKGDRVALHLPNCPQYAIAYFGILKAGAIVTPTNPIYTPRELEYQLNDSGAEALVILSQFYHKVDQIRANTKLKHVIVTNIKEYFPTHLKTLFTLAKEKKDGHRVVLRIGDYDFQALLGKGDPNAKSEPVGADDDAVLLYTGGTTGVPKAAELSHRNLLSNVLQVREWFHGSKETEDVFLTALPLFHSYAMTCCMNIGIYLGGRIILIPNPRDLEHILKSVDKHHATVYPAVPTMYVSLINHREREKYKLSSIKACISGAAGLPQEVQKKFQEVTGARLVEGYGLSESSPVTHANPVFGEDRIGTVGLPYPSTDAKIFDVETGEKEMPVGESGELVVSGPQVMKGYWKKPEETRNTLRVHNDKVWLHTGDIAVMDPDGYFRIVDRKKEMIITGGFNVYPREVEEVIFTHPSVMEAAVIGIRDEHSGERVKAFVVLKQGKSATEDEIIAFCRKNLAPYKVPKYVDFRESLPKSVVGKVLRRELVAEEKAKAISKN